MFIFLSSWPCFFLCFASGMQPDPSVDDGGWRRGREGKEEEGEGLQQHHWPRGWFQGIARRHARQRQHTSDVHQSGGLSGAQQVVLTLFSEALFIVFVRPNPKLCLCAHACLFKHFKVRNKPVFDLAFTSKDGEFLTLLPCGRVSSVSFQIHGFKKEKKLKEKNTHRNCGWKHQPWSLEQQPSSKTERSYRGFYSETWSAVLTNPFNPGE